MLRMGRLVAMFLVTACIAVAQNPADPAPAPERNDVRPGWVFGP